MKIRKIEAIGISVPMVKPLKMSFEEVRAANNVLVRLETSEGVVGWGEAGSAPTRRLGLSSRISSGNCASMASFRRRNAS